jgi:hypothetical protein
MGQLSCRMLRLGGTRFFDECYLHKDYSFGSQERREEPDIIQKENTKYSYRG